MPNETTGIVPLLLARHPAQAGKLSPGCGRLATEQIDIGGWFPAQSEKGSQPAKSSIHPGSKRGAFLGRLAATANLVAHLK
jgi:hypothetical protein